MLPEFATAKRRRFIPPCSIRPLEQMRIVRLVDQGEALPGVLLHVEHERFDFMSAGFDRATRAARSIQLGLHVGGIDHGRLHHVSNFGTLA